MAREERSFRDLFHRAVLLALAIPVAAPVACGAPTLPTSGDGGSSGTTGPGKASAESSSAGATTGSGSCDLVPFMPNPPDSCGVYVRLPCGIPADVVPTSNCFLTLADCAKFCTGSYFNCHGAPESCSDAGIIADQTGGVDIDCSICSNGIGRVPAGLARARTAPARSETGRYFAAMARLEAASVHAFARLRDDLAEHGAPAGLLSRARRAERDEVRHARLTARVARRRGAVPSAARVRSIPARSFEAIAIENAVEGCVNETLGAAVATFQAANAKDPEIAALMRSIARDETRHAELSWSIARWSRARLDDAARARLDARVRDAVASIAAAATFDPSSTVRDDAGLPTPEQRRAIVGALDRSLWSAFASRC